jgi:hypothetical protein
MKNKDKNKIKNLRHMGRAEVDFSKGHGFFVYKIIDRYIVFEVIRYSDPIQYKGIYSSVDETIQAIEKVIFKKNKKET